jgi:hypothetical protein
MSEGHGSSNSPNGSEEKRRHVPQSEMLEHVVEWAELIFGIGMGRNWKLRAA